jgi:dihydroorotate dehydrogenase (fumarate)
MNTETSYLGFRLPHPFIAGASPLGYHLDSIRRLEDAGCAAIVLPSLFEEQITLAATGRIRHRDPLDQEFAAALASFPAADDFPMGPQEYGKHVSQAKVAVKIPVIGSLNGTSAESWLTFSRIIGWLDRYLVDGVLNVVSAWTVTAGDELRSIQTGRAQDYIYGVAVGLLILILWMRWAVA